MKRARTAGAALRHSILSAAVCLDRAGVGALTQASADLVGMLLRWVAAERGEPVSEVAAVLRADLLLLEVVE